MCNIVREIPEDLNPSALKQTWEMIHILTGGSAVHEQHILGCIFNVWIHSSALCGAIDVNCSEPTQPALLKALAPIFNLSAIRPVMNMTTPTNVSTFFTLYGILGVVCPALSRQVWVDDALCLWLFCTRTGHTPSIVLFSIKYNQNLTSWLNHSFMLWYSAETPFRICVIIKINK